MMKPEPEKLIRLHGGYRKLKRFQVSQLAYDVTIRFCNRYIDRRGRTHDQMVQAALPGVQNIAEGSQASRTSRKIEMKLTSIANASVEELTLDFEDFLRQRRLRLWPKADSPSGCIEFEACNVAKTHAAFQIGTDSAREN